MASLSALPGPGPAKGPASRASSSSAGKQARSALKSAPPKPDTTAARIIALVLDREVSNKTLSSELEKEPLKEACRNDAITVDCGFELKLVFKTLGSRTTQARSKMISDPDGDRALSEGLAIGYPAHLQSQSASQ